MTHDIEFSCTLGEDLHGYGDAQSWEPMAMELEPQAMAMGFGCVGVDFLIFNFFFKKRHLKSTINYNFIISCYQFN